LEVIVTENSIRVIERMESGTLAPDDGRVVKLLVYALRSRFKPRARLEAENLVLRQQINVLIRKLPKGGTPDGA
jgi:hypothetical protein